MPLGIPTLTAEAARPADWWLRRPARLPIGPTLENDLRPVANGSSGGPHKINCEAPLQDLSTRNVFGADRHRAVFRRIWPMPNKTQYRTSCDRRFRGRKPFASTPSIQRASPGFELPYFIIALLLREPRFESVQPSAWRVFSNCAADLERVWIDCRSSSARAKDSL